MSIELLEHHLSRINHIIDMTRDEIKNMREEFELRLDLQKKQTEALRTLLANYIFHR